MKALVWVQKVELMLVMLGTWCWKEVFREPAEEGKAHLWGLKFQVCLKVVI